MPSVAAVPDTSQRHAGLDAARALAMMIVVATHATISFMVTPIGWAIQDDSRHLGVDLYVWTMRAFAMPTFFWLSGYFACALYRRGGLAGFLRHRATRVLLPLILSIVPCSFALDALWDWGREIAGRPDVAAHVPKLEGSRLPLTLGHLWYLYYLLVMSACAAVIAESTRRLRITSISWLVPVVLVASAAPLLAAGTLQLDTPLGFVVDPYVTLYFGAFFAWGWFAQVNRQLDSYAHYAWQSVAASAVLLGAVLPALRDGRAPVFAIVASGALTMAMIAAFIGLCVRYARRAHPAIAGYADASYWIYITHFPLVVLLQIAFAHVALPGIVEWLLITTATTAGCLVSYLAFARVRGWRAASRAPAGTRSRAGLADTP